MALDAGHRRMEGQRPERSAEPLVALVVDRLVAEEQHQMVGQRLLQRGGLPIRQRLAQVQPADLRANPRGQRRYDDLTHGRSVPIRDWFELLRSAHFLDAVASRRRARVTSQLPAPPTGAEREAA
jgi:hypothetical protein